MIKRIMALMTAAVLCIGCLSSCSLTENSLEGAHVFVFKCTGNAYGNTMYEGFRKAILAAGEKSAYKCPAEPTVAAQVEMLDTLIIQKVASITVSTCGDTGYDEIFRRAREAGIPVVSVDSAASPDYRVTHVDACPSKAVGSALVQSATLIALGVDYPADGDREKAVQTALAAYDGKELQYGVLSSSVDTPVQNEWIAKMELELEKEMYHGKVSPVLDKKYGNDDPNESTTQANAFVAEGKVDMIISPTTIGMAAAGEVLRSANSPIKLTGLGLPSEMQGFMPCSPEDDPFSFVCPYMFLWNVEDLGRAAGVAMLEVIAGRYDGAAETPFTFDGKTVLTAPSDDGGTYVAPLDPYFFNKDNMAEWKDIL